MEGKVVVFMMTLCSLASFSNAQIVLVFENRAMIEAGGKRFNESIGSSRALSMLASATQFIQHALYSGSTNIPQKQVSKITLILEDSPGVAYTSEDMIHLSQSYVAGYSGDVAKEVKGILYHESTHVWQWNRKGQAPGGLIEGVADWICLRAALPANDWGKSGGGAKWDQGYSVTAFFLDYCESLKSGFVRDLNAKLATGWSSTFFQDLLGKTVDQLWQSYKRKYNSS